MAADIEEDSLSEGSPISNGDDDADVEGSEASERETSQDPEVVTTSGSPNGAAVGTAESRNGHAIELPSKPNLNGVLRTAADTDAMLNGLKISGDVDTVEETNFEESMEDVSTSHLTPVKAPSEMARQETLAERSRREHQEYLKKRNEDPAFVPNRGGFFLHDNRASAVGVNGVRPFARGRGKGSFANIHSS
jgi:hypothetical protein